MGRHYLGSIVHMKIRKATSKDINQIAELMLGEFSKKPFNEKAKLQDVTKSLRFFLKIGSAYIAIDEDIVGVIVYKKEQYWEGPVIIVEDLAVKESHKGQGIGKKLLEKIEQIKDIKHISFHTHKKSKAVQFYKKLGYKINNNTILMSKKLNK